MVNIHYGCICVIFLFMCAFSFEDSSTVFGLVENPELFITIKVMKPLIQG